MKSTLADRMKLALTGPPKRSQIALAKACGVTPPSVNGWVSGASKSLEGLNLVKAAAYLNVSPKWLADGSGPMLPKQPSENSDLPVAVDPPAYLLAKPTPETLAHTLAQLSAIVASSDDLTRDQLKPLFTRMFDEPQRAVEIVQRIEDVISSSKKGRSRNLPDQDMPGFLIK